MKLFKLSVLFFYIVALVVILPENIYADAYSDSVNQAQSNANNPGPLPVDWRASNLIIIPDGGANGLQYDSSGNLIVRNATKSSNYVNNYVGQQGYKIFGQPTTDASFVSTGSDFTDFYNTNGKPAGYTNTTLIQFVERSLGINDASPVHNAIVEFTVDPHNSFIMRPTKNPDIRTANDTQYGNSDTVFPFQKPDDMSDVAFNNFKAYYASFRSKAYPPGPASSNFPWTQLGYTYYWNDPFVTPTQLSDVQGLTEFIILGGTPVNIYGIYSTVSYIYALDPATGQYGNGYANFHITDSCNTVWAGHSFQKRVSYSASSPNTITIDTGVTMAGGEGILVWSLNYTINNSGTISGTTSTKYGIAGTSNIAILFEGDTSTDYGTPITQGINKVTNQAAGIIGDAGVGTAIKIWNGDTTITNSGTIQGATAVDIEGGTATITNVGAGTITGNIILGANTTAALNLGNSALALSGAASSYIQGAGTTLKAAVDSSLVYGSITGISTASLSGTLKTTTTGTYAVGTTLSNFMTTTGGVTGTFGIFDTPITPTIVWKTHANGTNLDLVATRDYNNYPLNLSLTKNQENVASLMESVLPPATGDLTLVKNAIDSLSTNAQVAGAYSQVSPESLNGITTMAFTTATMQFDNLQGHLEELRSGIVQGMSFNSFNGSFRGDLFNDKAVPVNSDGAKPEPYADPVRADYKKYGFFIYGEGDFGSQDSTERAPGFDYTAGGATAGVDLKLFDALIAGLNAGYARTCSSIYDNGGKIEIDSLTYGLYGTYFLGNAYLDLAGQFASNFYHTKRHIAFGGLTRDATGDPFGQQWTIGAGTGFDLHIKKLITGPAATFKYSQLWINNFSETGAGTLDLDVNKETAESCQMGIGWRAEYELEIDKHKIFPEARLSYQHEFLNGSRSIEAKLADVTFTTLTDSPSRDFVLAGCGIAFRITDSVSFNVGYQVQAGQNDFFAQNINGDVKAYF